MKKIIAILVAITLVWVLHGCANSATHQVVSREKITDEYLTCSAVRREKRKAQIIINGVTQDKSDMTGADWADGILWFPFNVLVKHSNYTDAMSAAEARIEHLTLLEADMGCGGAYSDATNSRDRVSTKNLRRLNELYKDGILSESEYLAKRNKIMDDIAEEVAPVRIKREMRRHEIQAIELSVSYECNDSVKFVRSNAGIDSYLAECPDDTTLDILCKYGKCLLMR